MQYIDKAVETSVKFLTLFLAGLTITYFYKFGLNYIGTIATLSAFIISLTGNFALYLGLSKTRVAKYMITFFSIVIAIRIPLSVTSVSPVKSWIILISVAGLIFVNKKFAFKIFSLLFLWVAFSTYAEINALIPFETKQIPPAVGLIVEFFAYSVTGIFVLIFLKQIELYQQKIKENEKKALSAERSKSEFLANMSHEIRTPMNGIIGVLQLIKDSKLDEEQLDMLKTIEVSSNNLLRIINDILDLSKIQAGKVELEKICFDLNRQLNSCVEVFKPLAVEKNIKIKFLSSSDKNILVIGDTTRLNQIIMNLISNAIKFTKQGEVTITSEIVYESEHTYDISIHVKDTGVGISQKGLEGLFQDFQQADSSISRKFGGTGLGLSISSKLAALMDASITVESQYKSGSVFTLNIPLSKSSQAEVFEDFKTSMFENLSHRFPHSILVVEDNVMNQKIIKKMLFKLGYTCVIADNGEKAIQTVKEFNNSFSLIFMDMQMPIMDGIEATKELANQYGQDFPTVVAMTANVMVEDKQKCFQAGMKDYIAKPIKVEELKRLIVNYSLLHEKRKSS